MRRGSVGSGGRAGGGDIPRLAWPRVLAAAAVLVAAIVCAATADRVQAAVISETAAAAATTEAAAPTVTELRVIPEAEALRLRWSVTSTQGLQGFRMRWRPVSAEPLPWSAPVELSAAARGYTITSLAVRRYEVLVRAVLNEGVLGSSVRGYGTPLPPPLEETEGAVIHAAPVGPLRPSSGWHLVYADAFGAALGSGAGQDNTMETEEKWDGCCTNSTEVSVEQRSQNLIGPEGLDEVCEVGRYTVEGHTRKASCGGVRTDTAPRPFEFAPALVGEWAVECYVRMPVDEGGADPGCWTYPSPSGEIDFFELWGWNGTSWATANGGMPVVVGQGEHELSPVESALGFGPAFAFHRYTTVFVPEGSGKYDVREYIDGVYRWHLPGRTLTALYDGLIITNDLRHVVQHDRLTVRSIALWQDGAHAGQGVKQGGIAPGTTVIP